MVDFEEDEFDESDEDDSDAESEVVNPPYVTRVPRHRMGPHGLMLPWAHDIWGWSTQQEVRPPFGMDQGMYDLRHGESADHACPVIVKRIRDIGEQAQTTVAQMEAMRDEVEHGSR